jgi:hypothetical protein
MLKISISRFTCKGFHFKIPISRFPFQDFHFKISILRFPFQDFHFKLSISSFPFQDFPFKISISRFSFPDFHFKISIFFYIKACTRASHSRPFYALRVGHPTNGLMAVSGVPSRMQGGHAAVFYPFGHPTPYAYVFPQTKKFLPIVGWGASTCHTLGHDGGEGRR